MAKDGKQFKSKPAGKFAVKAGPSGGMHDFSGVSPQTPDRTATAAKGGKGGKFSDKLPVGGSGKMQKFSPVKAVKKA